jgi:NCS1 family nucleobase:cation symporter-1
VIAINVIAFTGAIGRQVPVAAQHIYDLNYFCGFGIAAVIYWNLCKVSPIPATSDTWLKVGVSTSDDFNANTRDAVGRYDGKIMTGGSGEGPLKTGASDEDTS